jgi:hypothetical protein
VTGAFWSEGETLRLAATVANSASSVGVLSDLFVAERPDVPIELGGPTSDGRYLATDVKGLDPVKLAALAQLVFDGAFESGDEASYGGTYDVFITRISEPAHQESDDGPWVLQIPEEFRVALRNLADDELSTLAQRWYQAEEFRLDGLSDEDALDYLRELARLARAAEPPKQLFLWMSL